MLLQPDVSICLSFLTFAFCFLTAIAIPTEFSDLERRQGAPTNGIHIIPGTCPGIQQTNLENAIRDSSSLASAGLNAAADFENPPFSYFFKGDLITANTVAAVLRRVRQVQKGQGPLIGVTCRDMINHCDNATAGYTMQFPSGDKKPPIIVICPIGLSLKRNPWPPCSEYPGAISLGWLFLHQIVQVRSIAGPTYPIQDHQGTDRASLLHAMLLMGGDTTKVSDAYAHLGSYSWDVGLGAEPWFQREVCREQFWTGQFDLDGLDAVSLSE